MRFGIVTPRIGFNDGQGRVNLEIATEIVRQGHELTLFSEHVGRTVEVDMAKQVVLPPPAWLPSRLLRDQVLAWRTRSQLHDPNNRCDAVLANGFVSWAHSDVNAVHFVHASWMRSPFHPWQRGHGARALYALTYSRLNTVLERGALRRCHRIVAVSEKVRCELSEIGVLPERIKVIANGVDTAEFYPGLGERDRLGLPGDVVMGLFAGDLKSPRKNLETVLRAMLAVPTLHLAVAGWSEASAYPAQVHAMGLQDRVHFVGFRTDMPALMRSVDLFVFPSRYEACSLVLLEAMASGLPVITARSAGGAELISPDIGVVLEDSNDHAGLAAALQPLVAHADRRRAMSRTASSRAREHSWAAMAGQYIELLREAAEMRGRIAYG